MQAEGNVIAAGGLKGGESQLEAEEAIQKYHRKPTKLPHQVIVKAPGLFNMMYKPSELAEDLDMPERTLRDWLAAGAPCHPDDRKHIWINGTEFAEWVEAQRKPKKDQKSAEDEAFCFRCKQMMRMVNPHITNIEGKRALMSGQCPVCGGVINRGVHHD